MEIRPRFRPEMRLINGTGPDRRESPVNVEPVALARRLAVLSGKGGVGKTNIVANLAISLARRGQRIVLVDADWNLGNLDLLMGVVPRYTVEHLLTGGMSPRDVAVSSYSGVRVIPASSGDHDIADLDDIRRERLLRSLSIFDGETDMILIDGGAGIGRNITGLARFSGEILVVTTPEPTAISGAWALLKTIDHLRLPSPPRVIVNQAASPNEARETWRRIDKACKQFLDLRPEYWGWIPTDEVVGRAVRAQEPFLMSSPTGPAARAIHHLAQRVLEDGSARGPDPVERGTVVPRLKAG